MILTHATLITMDPQRRIIQDGAIAIVGNEIVSLGKTADVVQALPDLERFDYSHHIIAPGLIDTHVHLSQALLRGISEVRDMPEFLGWLYGRMLPLEGSYSHADAAASASLCIVEMLKSGTTTFLECLLTGSHGFENIAQLCLDSGIRAALGKVVMDVPAGFGERVGWHPAMWDRRDVAIKETLAAHDTWHGAGDGRLQVWFGCRSADGSTDPTLYDEVSALARERDMGLTIHFAELPSDNEYARSLGYRSHMDFAYEHGLLGRRSVLAHCTATDEEDHDLLARTGTSVAHNAANNAAAGWGPARVGDMLDAGVNVALACDGAPSNACMDMLRDLRIACHVARGLKGRRDGLRAETALEMATINGARALGLEHQVGSLEVGKKADIITINTDVPHLTPVWNPVATTVFAAQGGDVDTVIIDGRVIMRGRRVLSMDENAIVTDARSRYRDVARRAGVSGIEPVWPIV